MWPGGRVGKCIINPVVVGCSLDDVGICTGTWLAKVSAVVRDLFPSHLVQLLTCRPFLPRMNTP
jgi:hypothetical protein